MPTRIGINGFGRIGRQVFKAISDRHPDEIEVVAVNDLASPEANAHLLKYDTNYGINPSKIEVSDGTLVVDERRIRVFAERDPAKIPWGDVGAELVVESTGFFTDAEKAAGHRQGGAKKVIITAPAKNEDLTLVMGVNEQQYDPQQHHIVSNASCTTNCLATAVKPVHEKFGITKGLMTTVHSYTNDQKILDVIHEDMRRARAAAMNIIPTTTGAARAVSLVIPDLKGRFHGFALRVPTSTVSIVDFVANVGRKVTVQEINDTLREAAETSLKGIVEYTEEPLVSSDFKMNPHSSIIDGLSTMVIGDDLIKVVAWYDNEWGYSCRVSDLTAFMAGKGL
ncbi:MAG TPA: type I glyceraldehyde-3-phosphate dehydrogenase [Dehalococcoidia bacterium]|nr:type I glyceraldehyde-3-phosphate dehydrogenase [Dehalococcoidia bacterium]